MLQILVLVGLGEASEVVDSGGSVGAPVSVSFEYVLVGIAVLSVVSIEDVGLAVIGGLVSALLVGPLSAVLVDIASG